MSQYDRKTPPARAKPGITVTFPSGGGGRRREEEEEEEAEEEEEEDGSLQCTQQQCIEVSAKPPNGISQFY